MAIQKSEYELSVWNEELNSDGIKEESRGVTIGAHDMTHLGRAIALKLTRSIKGTNVLSFLMPTKYFDSEKGDYVKNELIEDLYNERKLKLYFDGNWYEFYIKKITENKQYKAIMKLFECTDSFIDELSRTGYEVEFAPELNNSVEEIGVFMETEEDLKIKGSSKAILDGSVWDYRPDMNTGDFTEYKEMRFYKIPLSLFGGSITGYPINLEVEAGDLKNTVEGKSKEDRATMTNPFTYERRPLEYGDDLARVEELFWDPYKSDNGRELLSSKNLVTLTGDYIYVPITDLSFIMGGLYNNASVALEEPAIYGPYDYNSKKYALQPTSKIPTDLILFIFFNEGEEVLIDEVGTVANNNCHYVIKIELWNELLKKIFDTKPFKRITNDEGLIHWTSPVIDDETYIITNKYSHGTTTDKKTLYSVNVLPNTRTIDDFCWYPVYYEGYLDKIGKTEVGMARKISITDRTEYNLNDDIYTTVYNNPASKYKNLYSESELEGEAAQDNLRVVSKLATRQILPSLARNLVTNGEKITDVNGWEAKTLNINENTDLGTGSFKKLMELSIQAVSNRDNNIEPYKAQENTIDGTNQDEIVSDYYLLILSPVIEKTENFNLEGTTEIDYALNFGIPAQDKKIEKDKVYAIRLISGQKVVSHYSFYTRVNNANNEDKSIINPEYHTEDNTGNIWNKADMEKFEETIKDFLKVMIYFLSEENDSAFSKYLSIKTEMLNLKFDDKDDEAAISKLDLSNVSNDLYLSLSGNLLKILNKIIEKHDSDVTNEYEKWANLIIKPEKDNNGDYTESTYNRSDLKYLKYAFISHSEAMLELYLNSVSTSFYRGITNLTSLIIKTWLTECIVVNADFKKGYNIDLDKIIIGEGSTNLQGNYVIDGIDNTTGSFISFTELADIAIVDAKSKLTFIPKAGTSDYLYLTLPLYYSYNSGNSVAKDERWYWKTDKNKDIFLVEDNAFLLFKAKKTINNPYIALKVESGVAALVFDDIQRTNYVRTNNKGLKIDIIANSILNNNTTDSTRLDIDDYSLINNCLVEIYGITDKNFSEDFLTRVGFVNNEDDYGIDLTQSGVETTNYGTLKDGDLLEKATAWKGYSSSSNPLYFSAITLGTNLTPDKTRGFAIFIDKKYYGIFWLEKRGE